MTNAELDAMKATADMAAWHELNKEDPKAKEAVEKMCIGIREIELVERLLTDAAYKVENTPEFDRITSLRQDLESLECDIRKQVRRMGGQA